MEFREEIIEYPTLRDQVIDGAIQVFIVASALAAGWVAVFI